MAMLTVSELMQRLVKSAMSCIMPMRAMDVDVFVLWLSMLVLKQSHPYCWYELRSQAQ
jgi:hypothetical protein